eukprot:5539817-Pleurochrysis_carterae.AAC.2
MAQSSQCCLQNQLASSASGKRPAEEPVRDLPAAVPIVPAPAPASAESPLPVPPRPSSPVPETRAEVPRQGGWYYAAAPPQHKLGLQPPTVSTPPQGPANMQQPFSFPGMFVNGMPGIMGQLQPGMYPGVQPFQQAPFGCQAALPGWRDLSVRYALLPDSFSSPTDGIPPADACANALPGHALGDAATAAVDQGSYIGQHDGGGARSS